MIFFLFLKSRRLIFSFFELKLIAMSQNVKAILTREIITKQDVCEHLFNTFDSSNGKDIASGTSEDPTRHILNKNQINVQVNTMKFYIYNW